MDRKVLDVNGRISTEEALKIAEELLLLSCKSVVIAEDNEKAYLEQEKKWFDKFSKRRKNDKTRHSRNFNKPRK